MTNTTPDTKGPAECQQREGEYLTPTSPSPKLGSNTSGCSVVSDCPVETSLDPNPYRQVKPDIDRNTKARINWKEVFGFSVSKIAGKYHRNGYPWETCFKHLEADARKKGVDDEGIRKLKIGVASMYAKLDTVYGRRVR